MTAPVTDRERELDLRAAALGLLAAAFGPRPESFVEQRGHEALTNALSELGDADALDELEGLDPATITTARLGRLFDLGRVAPYEASCTPGGVGGHTARLADVSGFYRAFGFHVPGERPDHCAAELEFACWLTISESDARRAGEDADAAVYADAAADFLRDHLGGWLDLLADRISDRDPDGPFGPLARAAARLVGREAERRGVEIIAVPLPRPWDTGIDPGDDLDEVPMCAGCQPVPPGS